MKVLSIVCACGAVALLAWATPSRANEWNQLTYFTFSAPVELPGVTLPAGTYMFKHPDSLSDRHIVQVFSKDGKTIYATIMAIPDTRLTPSGRPVVTFEETPAGAPEAIKAWFYPGETIGDEFVYPKEQALKIASATHQPVLSTASVLPKPATSPNTKQLAALGHADVSRVTPSGQIAPLHSDLSARVAPMKSLDSSKPAAPVATSGQAPTPATSQHPANSSHRRMRAAHLPATASNLPLAAVLSLCLIGLGVGVRVLRTRPV